MPRSSAFHSTATARTSGTASLRSVRRFAESSLMAAWVLPMVLILIAATTWMLLRRGSQPVAGLTAAGARAVFPRLQRDLH